MLNGTTLNDSKAPPPLTGESLNNGENDAMAQADRAAVETMIRTTALSLANGAPIKDLDGIISRNASRVRYADIRAGHLDANVLGDIISAVESGKASSVGFNWATATPEQMKAYLHAMGLDPSRFGLGMQGRGSENGTSSADGTRGQAASSYNGKMGAVDPAHYAGTPFERAGLSYETFNSLRKQGFGETNIVHAAEDAKQNGFDQNDKAVAKDFAVLDQDDGRRRDERNKLLGGFRDQLRNDQEMQKLRDAYKNAANDEERAKIEGQARARGIQIGRTSGLQQHIDTMPTKRAKESAQDIEFKAIHQELTGSVLDLSHGNAAKAKDNSDIIEKYRRNPDDAAARKNYEGLKRAAAIDPKKQLAMAKIEKDLAKDEKLKAGVSAKNQEKKEQTVAQKDDNDALFASMTASPAPEKKAEVSPSKAAPKNAVAKSDTKAADNQKPKLANNLKPVV